eukprot:scaffold137401_cov31-Tisochrysis_lutea.AAC.6
MYTPPLFHRNIAHVLLDARRASQKGSITFDEVLTGHWPMHRLAVQKGDITELTPASLPCE